MKPHRKQYIIGPEPIFSDEQWICRPIGADLFLSHCPELIAQTITDLDGVSWHLLGLAAQTSDGLPEPPEQIASSKTADVPRCYQEWAGRWILIGNGAVHLDCFGMIGCFYTSVGNQRWISSSLGILQQRLGLSPRPEQLKYKSPVEWFPPPQSRFAGVRKLLPSQLLHLGTLEPQERPFPGPVAEQPYEVLLEQIRRRMQQGITGAAQLGKRLWIPLTCGYDSRLILALTHDAGIPAATYTQEHYRITSGDFWMPFRLAKAAGFRHWYIWKRRFCEQRDHNYQVHTGGNIDDLDRLMYAHGQWDGFQKGDILLRGGGFEVGRCGYWRRITGEMRVEAIMKDSKLKPAEHAGIIADLESWLEWVRQHPVKGLDWRDRYYMEQRVCGWLSSLEQSLDLTSSERFYIVNCHATVSLLLALPVELRAQTRHHTDLIARLCPALAKYPFQKKGSQLFNWSAKAVRMSRLPLPELYKTLKQKLRPARPSGQQVAS